MRSPVRFGLFPRAYTLFGRLLALPDRLSCSHHRGKHHPHHLARPSLEVMEERMALNGTPLPAPAIFVSSGIGYAPVVQAYSADTGTLRYSASVSTFGASYTGGVRVAAGDFTGDGVPDAVLSTASGTNASIEILDGTTGSLISRPLSNFTAYSSITGGGVLTATGDIEGNGITDLITAAQTSGGLEIKVFSGTDGSVLADFDVTGTAFSGAVSLAAGDFTGSGKADVVVGGSGGWVGVYDPLSGSALSGTLGGLQVFGSGYTGGVVSVAADPLAGVANPGATSVLAVGTGAGATTEVKLLDASGTVLQDIEPFGSSDTNGAQVALAYISDPTAPTVPDMVVGSGAGDADSVRVFSGTTGGQLAGTVGLYTPFGTDTSGVIVAASNDPATVSFSNPVGTSTATVGTAVSYGIEIDGQYINGTPILPTGTVTFTATNTSTGVITTLGSGTVIWDGDAKDDGEAFVSSSVPLAVGTYTITAHYSGDSNYSAATSTVMTLTVTRAPTTTSLTSSGPSVYGQSVTFTATVTTSGSGTPTGTVTFLDGTTAIGSGTLNGSGVATFSTTSLTAGTHSITAAYSGDTNFNASTSSPLTQTVNKASTTTTLASSSAPALSSQKITLTATVAPVSPGAGAPTGTVTFYKNGTSIGSAALSAGVATLSGVVLTTGSYTLTATYGGDTNFNTSTSSSFTQSTNAPPVAKTPSSSTICPTGGSGTNVTTPKSATNPGAPPASTGKPVEYSDGVATIAATDLASGAFGMDWSQARTWSNAPAYSTGSDNGNGWTDGSQPHLVLVGSTLYLMVNASTAYTFAGQGTANGAGIYPTYADTSGLLAGGVTYNSSTDTFALPDGSGGVMTFDGFGSSRPAAQQGALVSRADGDGNLMQVVAWTAAGEPAEVAESGTVGGVTYTAAYFYTYLPSTDPNAGKLATVALEQQTGGGAWQTVQSVTYQYYTTGAANGNLGDLERAIIKDPAGNVLGEYYYRYYTSTVMTGGVQTGYQGGLEDVVDPDQYARLQAVAGGTDAGVDAATQATVATYVDNYFQYDSLDRVTEEIAAGVGCSLCSAGQGTYTFAYTTSTNAAGYNSWATKTVVTLPSNAVQTVYTNAYAQVMLSAIADPVSGVTDVTYYRYNSLGQVVLVAAPSAVSGYSDSYADLVNYSGTGSTYLSSSSGLVQTFSYYSSTTATATTAGGVLNYVQSVSISQGQLGTAVPQEAWTYFDQTVGSAIDTPIATDTVYRNTNGTGAQTTSYSYTWYSGTAQEQSVTTTLPTNTTAENGSGTANTTVTVYDPFGNVQWIKDANGYIDYAQTDPLTGAVVKSITDVDTTQANTFTNLPSGWSTRSGGGLQLVTTYSVDSLGRATKETAPNGNVTYWVYDDPDHEVRTYVGWNASTGTPTGPTTVTIDDWAAGVTEILTMSAAPTVSGGTPTGTEPITQIQSLTIQAHNAAGQMTAEYDYFNLAGLTWATGVILGTAGVNYDQTQYAYAADGGVERKVDQLGTITRTVYNAFGQAVSVWVGTNDTPASGYWSPTNNTGTSNMVQVASYQYDGGGSGDGNLTAVTEYPGGGAAAEETEYWYDWRDRKVAEKSGVQTSESSGVNRPLTVWTYDNLNEVTEVQVYAADGLAPTISGGVLSLPGGISSDLRAQITTSYDELGQVYEQSIYDVNPSTGAVGTYTLNTLTWCDPNGHVIETQAPGGLVTKDTYDGAGRKTAEYTTDGAGGTSYAAASSVASDDVLTQTVYTYDGNGNVLEAVTSDRFDSATGTGALGTPTTGVNARVSYVAYYYDLADRRIASVNVGTNGGAAWTRPSSVPTGSSTVLVTSISYSTDAVQNIALTGGPTGGTFTLTFGGQTTSALAYNATAAAVQSALQALSSIGSGNVAVMAAPSGTGWEVRFTGTLANSYEGTITGNGSSLTGGTSQVVAVATISAGGDAGSAAIVTDPLGEVTRTYTDAEGRTVRTVQDFTNGVVTGTSNATTGYTYNQVGVTSVTAYQSGGGVQVTAYAYGVTTGTGSTINSNDIVGITEYPDGTSGLASSAQEVTNTVNALGQALTLTDRNGTTHTYTYDVLGRQVSDAVTTLGSGVDGTVRLITTAYDGQGHAYLVTSYSATSGGTVVNQVQRLYNGLGQLTADYQSASGAVNTSSTPVVQYAYTETAGGVNNSRLTSITYPDGYVLTYNYSSGLNNTISRLSSLSDTTGTLESYKYLGLDTVVERDHPQINVNQTFITGGTGDAGDKYVGLDRFGRVVDDQWVNTSTITDEFQYGYDADSNVLWRNNNTTAGSSFGELYTYTGENALASFQRGTLNGTKTGLTGTASASQSYVTNGVGNFTSVTTNGTTQTRTANAQNEITGISGATTPTYDSNGDMTGDQNGNTFVYDAWNMLVAVKNASGTTLETFSYDGLGRRVTATAGGATTDLYYSDLGQVLEEEVSGAATTRYVWSPVYVNAMVLRDNATGSPGTLNQRLWVQQDTNWNVTALVNSSGSVVERYVYSPYGVVTIYNAGYTSTLSSSAYGWVYGFQGMRYDATSGLNESLSRFYSPALQIWTTMDPIGFAGGNVDQYGFVNNNVTGNVDPTGFGPISTPLPSASYPGVGTAPYYGGPTVVPTSSAPSVPPYFGNWPTPPARLPLEPSGPTIVSIQKIGWRMWEQYDRDTAKNNRPDLIGRLFVLGIRALTPDSEQSTLITYSDGTKLFILGGGPSSGDMLGQALVLGPPMLRLAGLKPAAAAACEAASVAPTVAPTVAPAVTTTTESSSLLQKYLRGFGGRWGGRATRLQNHEIANQLEREGWTITGGAGRAAEEWIPGPFGGKKGSTWVDITATRNGQTLRIQTVDTYADGTMTAREAAAAARIRAAFPNDAIQTIPKLN